MFVKEVAELTGVSVRTLHHYHTIGLLIPEDETDAGYRVYSDENIATLQQILFFKELGFPLKKIKELLESPSYNRKEAFEFQRNLLLAKRERLTTMIETIEKTIKEERGEYAMTNEERFKGFDFSKGNEYEEEARAKYGDEAVDRANEQVGKQGFGEEMDEIFMKLAELRHLNPESEEAQAAIGEWYHFLTTNHHFPSEGFAGLGQLYLTDERFTNNIDQFGDGLALFMSEAMRIFAEKN